MMNTLNINKYELQQNLEDYIDTITSKSKYNQYVCPLCGSGTGSHHTGALSLKTDRNGVPRATCFACGGLQNSDLFETIGKVEGLNSFTEQINRAVELFGSTSGYNSVKKNIPVKEKRLKAANTAMPAQPQDFKEFIQQAHKNIYATDYLLNRGISQEVIDLFNIGYVKGWKHPNNQNMWAKNGVVIPISDYSYVFRDTCNSQYRYFKIKNRDKKVDKYFNYRALTEPIYPIYVTEGELDALSIITAGLQSIEDRREGWKAAVKIKAVSIGSVSNVEDFVDSLLSLDIQAPIIFFFDNDEAGRQAGEKARIELNLVNILREKRGQSPIEYFVHGFNIFKLIGHPEITELKDINDILQFWGVHVFGDYLQEISQKFITQIAEEAAAKMKELGLDALVSSPANDEPKEESDESLSSVSYTKIQSETKKETSIAVPSSSPANDGKKEKLNTTVSTVSHAKFQDEKHDYTKNFRLEVNTYIAEQQEAILSAISSSKKSLLIAPMGTGKTNLIPEINKDKDVVTVIVNPSVAQLQQMRATYDIAAVYGGLTYNDENIVCVTPESLRKKVISKLRKRFILVVDEAHEIYNTYSFRPAFADIKEVEKVAQKVIYMTATPDILTETEQFDAVISVSKKSDSNEKIKTTILEAESLGVAQKAAVIKKALKASRLVALHNDNKKENESIIEVLNKETKVKVFEDSYFQTDIWGSKQPFHKTIKNSAVSVDAGKKESKTFVELIKHSAIDADVNLFCTTSCIQAGLNINNNRETTVIYVCNNQSFKMVNFLQSIGRYRNKNNIKEIILLKTKKDKTERDFKNFSTLYEETKFSANKVLAAANEMHKFNIHFLEEEAAKKIGLNFNKVSNEYEINYHKLKATALESYNQSLLYHVDILKKELTYNSAIPLKVEIEEFKLDPTKEVQELIKEKNKANKEIFEETIQQMLKLSNEQLEEILNCSIDQRKKENEELVEIMKVYHETASTTFKNVLQETIEVMQLTEVDAFRYVAESKSLQDVKSELLKIKIKKANADIKEKGIELAYKAFKGYPKDLKKIVLIRYLLKDIETKKSRISNKTKSNIVEQAVRFKIYKEKDRDKALSDIEKLLHIIYKFDTQNKISSVNY